MPRSSRPTSGTATGRVWEIADELTRKGGGPARRSEVIRAYVSEGGNPGTANTQYQYWKAQRANQPGKATLFPSRRNLVLEVKEGGRVALPADIRAALGVSEGGTLTGVVVDGELHLMTRDTAVRKLQELVRRHVPENVSLVDELIAERREEQAREDSQ